MAPDKDLEIKALLDLAAKVGELSGKMDSVLAASREQADELRHVLNRLHETELALSNKRRPIVLGLSGGAVATVLLALIERFFTP